ESRSRRHSSFASISSLRHRLHSRVVRSCWTVADAAGLARSRGPRGLQAATILAHCEPNVIVVFCCLWFDTLGRGYGGFDDVSDAMAIVTRDSEAPHVRNRRTSFARGSGWEDLDDRGGVQ